MQARIVHGTKKADQGAEISEQLLAKIRSQAVQRADEYNDPGLYDEGTWRRKFLTVCREVYGTAYEDENFGGFIIICIIIAGVLVGVQTYEESLDDTTKAIVEIMDNIILCIFGVEVTMKIVGEGFAPWRFFIGREWKWNNFDFLVVFLCLPMWSAAFGGGNSIALLRLLRLARLVKLVRKVPQLQMIVQGLVAGLQSIAYILILMLLVFYLYAIMGIDMFGANDPWHFGSLENAMVTLFRASTMEDWTEIMYINIYGCDDYDIADSAWFDAECVDDKKPVEASLYFVSFTFVSGLVLLSLFIGSVTMGMNESMERSKQEEAARLAEQKRVHEEEERKARNEAKKVKKKKTKKMLIQRPPYIRVYTDGGFHDATIPDGARAIREEEEGPLVEKSDSNASDATASSTAPKTLVDKVLGVKTTVKTYMDERKRKKTEEGFILLVALWAGVDLTQILGMKPRRFSNPVRQSYHNVSIVFNRIVEHDAFKNFITIVIIVAGIMVGVGTDDVIVRESGHILDWIDEAILGIFILEIVCKFIALDSEPHRFFYSNWNCFDFAIVVGSFTLDRSMVTMLRLLRLLRVLKLLKALPQLQIIVETLIMGLSSIGFIGLILFMFFYLFAILGMMIFQENDPWHFGTLDRALLSLFRCSTLEDWTDVMYINIYGCDHYDGYPGECTDPNPNPGLAVMYFLVFIIIGALVLLTLFIGVVTTSMEEAQAKQERDRDIAERIEKLTQDGSLTPERLALFTQVFEKMDLDNDGILSLEELNVGLESTGKEIGEDTVKRMLSSLDSNDSGEVDMANFIETMNKIDTTLSKGTFPNSDHDALVSVAGFPGLFAREKGDKAGATLASTMATTLSSTMASTAAPEPKAKPSGVVIDDKGMPPLPSEPVRKLDDSPTDEFLKGVSQEAETMDDSRVHRFESGDSTIPRANSDTSLALQSPDASVASADISDSPRG